MGPCLDIPSKPAPFPAPSPHGRGAASRAPPPRHVPNPSVLTHAFAMKLERPSVACVFVLVLPVVFVPVVFVPVVFVPRRPPIPRSGAGGAR